MKKKNLNFYILSFVVFLSLILFLNFDRAREFLRQNLPEDTKIAIKKIFFGEKYLNEIAFYRKINYNQKVIPETEFVKISFEKILLNKLVEFSGIHYNKAVLDNQINIKKFFIDVYGEKLIISNVKGDIFFLSLNDLKNLKEKNSNIKNFKIHDVLDIAVVNNFLFLSSAYKKNLSDDCTFFQIIFANIDNNRLQFKNFYTSDQCLKNTLGGRIVKYNNETDDGILVTTGASETESHLAQKDVSIYGKILFFDIKTKEVKIFSKGHRNPQGLIVDGKNIISTEHGPYGGDEINKIIKGKNYGYPEASYGDSYEFKNNYEKNLDYRFKKNHKKFNFQEPIFSFIPSIGISEIVKVPNNFTKYWQENYLISSLNGRSIYRVKIGEIFDKIIYAEKIPIGERIRDIKFIPKLKSFVMALEETGSLGIMKIQD